MRVHELHDLDSLSRTQLHRGEALALDEDERSRPELCLSVSLRQGNHTITPSLQLRCAIVSEPSRTDGIAACCVHSTTSKQRGFRLRLLFTQTSSSDAQRTQGKKFLGRKNRNTKKCTKFFLRNWILFHRAQQNFRSKLVRQQRRQRKLKSTLGCSRNKQFSKIHLQIHQVLSLGPLLSSAWTRARKRV